MPLVFLESSSTPQATRVLALPFMRSNSAPIVCTQSQSLAQIWSPG
jgi:hypothetical protein